MNPDEGYPRARALLKQRFGNDFLIAKTWMKKVTSGKPIVPRTKKGYKIWPMIYKVVLKH